MRYNAGMHLARSLLTASAFALALATAAESRPLDTYNTIVVRNPFGLKDPPPQAIKETNPPAPPQKKEDFYLTGISTIGNTKRPKAYLLAKDASKKDYDEKFYSLNIGDRQGDVTLQEIDPKGRRVKIEYLGEEKWLSMKDNGVPAPAGAPAPGMIAPPGGMPSPVPLPLPQGAGGPMQPAQPVSYPNAGNTARRPIRTSGYGAPTGNFGAINSTGVSDGPQTDAEVLKQIVLMRQGEKQGIPLVTTPANGEPGNTAPNFPNLPTPTGPSRSGGNTGFVVPSPPIPQLPY
ncbi:MAG TPA: hypothetical protein VM680_19165 [Verrucomicrobiae bacterium]|nr:hypothetical protein [Verrucomicrobiae bacterium]